MIKKPSLRNSVKIQLRVIGALLMREILTRFGRHNIGFLWLFVEPMMFTLGVTGLWMMADANHGSSLPITAFALTGYSSVLVWRNTVSRTIEAIEPNLSLMYHRNVRVIDIFAARIVLEIVGAGMSFVILTIIFLYFGMIDPPNDILKVIFGWTMLAWLGASLALFLGALSEVSELVEKIWHPISYLLFPLSGAAFMVEWLPVEAQKAVLYLPMVHGTEMIRDGFFGAGVIHPHYDIGYMVFCCMVLTVLGFAVERHISRKVEPE
ncbi:ABC transporter permease [Sulfurovum sp.]|uniref:ABC transporter permease n=1 Tax=Sulfurovum sp. TaxID=1969726 RepID=UPI0025F67A98|nr:ABC transporter permease [Sulfurovum sp.]